jgi:hypothetical protein
MKREFRVTVKQNEDGDVSVQTSYIEGPELAADTFQVFIKALSDHLTVVRSTIETAALVFNPEVAAQANAILELGKDLSTKPDPEAN